MLYVQEQIMPWSVNYVRDTIKCPRFYALQCCDNSPSPQAMIGCSSHFGGLTIKQYCHIRGRHELTVNLYTLRTRRIRRIWHKQNGVDDTTLIFGSLLYWRTLCALRKRTEEDSVESQTRIIPVERNACVYNLQVSTYMPTIFH